MDHVRGAPNHPQTRHKIERCHQTLKTCILLENHSPEGEPEAAIAAFVDGYNTDRYHKNLTPADADCCRGLAIMAERKEIKTQSTQTLRLIHQHQAA